MTLYKILGLALVLLCIGGFQGLMICFLGDAIYGNKMAPIAYKIIFCLSIGFIFGFVLIGYEYWRSNWWRYV